MSSNPARLIPLAMILAAPLCAESLRMSYLYDKDDSRLVLNELKFPSAKRGIAIGMLIEKNRARPSMVSTSDGGQSWQVEALKDNPVSLFFLNDSLGWMVAEGGIWQTLEAGRDWRKVKSIKGVNRVHFLDANNGFAVGALKSVLSTADGGKNWTKVEAAAKVESTREFTSFNLIDFSGSLGLIAGVSSPPRRWDDSELDWVYPDRAAKRRELPHLSIVLQTRDKGKTWVSSASSIFGIATALHSAPWGALALFEFKDSFAYPSEILQVDYRTGVSATVHHDKKIAVTDVQWKGMGSAYAIGYEPAGALVRSPIPGKVRMIQSDGMAAWKTIDVDYRAVAHRVRLAKSPDGQVWAMTDAGMILKLVK